MNLTLEVVSQNGQSLGDGRRKVFGPEGGSIGRSPECTWVIANPYVSRHHATIRWISGTFYIEAKGDNGVGIGSQHSMLPGGERHALRNGDRFFIDEYEIAVGLVGATAEGFAPAFQPSQPSAGLIPNDDPFFGTAATQASPALVVDPLQPMQEDLDPLIGLVGRGGPSPNVTSPRQQSGWNHTPGSMDHFAPPPVPGGGGGIPDDWDRTSFGRGKPAAPPPAPMPSGASGIPDDWDRTSFGRGGKPTAAPPPPPPAPAARPGAPDARGRPSWPLPQAPAAPPSPPPPPVQHAVPPHAGLASTSVDLSALLRSAGVDPATLSPETAASLGYILRTVVQGVIDVLHARAEIKSQFRLPVTRVKQVENNPLKFAVNAEDALGSLLGRRNPAYLPATEAFEDAFDDIRFHQLAMLVGMRAGFESVLGRFDPERLQEDFEKHAKRGGLLSIAGKSRYWEMYVEFFQQLAGDPDSAFRRLFGEEFATAYEKQLDGLKRSHKKGRR